MRVLPAADAEEPRGRAIITSVHVLSQAKPKTFEIHYLSLSLRFGSCGDNRALAASDASRHPCLRIYSLCRASGFAGGSPRNQLRGERLTQQSSQGESLLRLVTIASTVVAFPVAVLQGRPASAVAALLIAAVWIAAATIHVWRKRSPSGKHKYSWRIIRNSIRRNRGRWLRGKNQQTCGVAADNR